MEPHAHTWAFDKLFAMGRIALYDSHEILRPVFILLEDGPQVHNGHPGRFPHLLASGGVQARVLVGAFRLPVFTGAVLFPAELQTDVVYLASGSCD